jgi:hypothetical protein
MQKNYLGLYVSLLAMLSPQDLFSKCNKQINISSKDVNRKGKGFIIDKPGYYVLCEDIEFKPHGSKPRTAITIKASDVVLNMKNHTLSQSEHSYAFPVLGVSANNLNSISIENGSVTDFTDAGIRIQNSTAIVMDEVNILRTGMPSAFGGIQINDSTDIEINKIISLNNFGCGMYLHGVIKTTVSNSHFDDNFGGNVAPLFFTGPGLVASGAYLDSSVTTESSDVLFQNCSFNRNSAGSDAGGLEVGPYSLLPVRNVTVLKCEFLDNFMMGESAQFNDASGLVLVFVTDYVIKDVIASGQRHPSPQGGLLITSGSTGISINACNNGIIENCQAFDNVGQGASSIGIRARGCNNLLVKNCEASANINTGSGEAFGFYTDPEQYIFFPPIGTANVFKDCIAQQNTSTTGLAGGFKFANLACSAMENCISQSNAIGIVVTDYNSPNIALNNIFKDNIVQCNTLSGINDQLTTSNNAYIKNIARSNGPAGTTNYVGLPAGTPIAVWTIPGAFPAGSNSFTNLDIRP